MKTRIKAQDYLKKLKKAAELETVKEVRYQIGKARGFKKEIQEAGADVPKSLLSRIESFQKRMVELGAAPVAERIQKESGSPALEYVAEDLAKSMAEADSFQDMENVFRMAKAVDFKFAIVDRKRGIEEPTDVQDIKLRLDAHNREIIDFILSDSKKLGYYVQSKTMPAKKFVLVS